MSKHKHNTEQLYRHYLTRHSRQSPSNKMDRTRECTRSATPRDILNNQRRTQTANKRRMHPTSIWRTPTVPPLTLLLLILLCMLHFPVTCIDARNYPNTAGSPSLKTPVRCRSEVATGRIQPPPAPTKTQTCTRTKQPQQLDISKSPCKASTPRKQYSATTASSHSSTTPATNQARGKLPDANSPTSIPPQAPQSRLSDTLTQRQSSTRNEHHDTSTQTSSATQAPRQSNSSTPSAPVKHSTKPSSNAPEDHYVKQENLDKHPDTSTQLQYYDNTLTQQPHSNHGDHHQATPAQGAPQVHVSTVQPMLGKLGPGNMEMRRGRRIPAAHDAPQRSSTMCVSAPCAPE